MLQGMVDYAGNHSLRSNAQVIATYAAHRLSRGPVMMPVRNDADSFVRTQVLNAQGAIVGLSNPVRLLRNPPARGIPESRGA